MSADAATLARAATLLEAHPDYRVLRALPSHEAFVLTEPQGPVRTAAVVDVETTGLEIDHPIIDLAIQRIAFDGQGRIVRVGQPREWFEDPGVPIPLEITRLTGITDTDVAGTRIADAEAAMIITSVDVVIAHNAGFDALRIERRLPAVVARPWACSCNEIAWPDLGFDGRKLGHLLMQQGHFHHGHRAATDVWATINLLGSVLPDGETALCKLIRQAEVPTIRVEATNAPFDAREALKGRGYRWNAGTRVWWTELPPEREAAERQWLQQKASCMQPKIETVTWHQRHRG